MQIERVFWCKLINCLAANKVRYYLDVVIHYNNNNTFVVVIILLPHLRATFS